MRRSSNILMRFGRRQNVRNLSVFSGINGSYEMNYRSNIKLKSEFNLPYWTNGFHTTTVRLEENNTNEYDSNNNQKSMNSLSSMNIPEVFPRLPLIVIEKQPLFPKFVKVIETTEKSLIDLLKQKVKLNLPYAGVFLRRPKNEEVSENVYVSSNEPSASIKDLNDIFHIGSFVQIHEIQHLNKDRIRFIVTAHRRISIDEIASDDLTTNVTTSNNRNNDNGIRGRHLTMNRFRRRNNSVVKEVKEEEEKDDEVTKSNLEEDPKIIKEILVSNVESEKIVLTDDVKALRAEIVKTIRDIISKDSLYRDSLSALMQAGNHMVDDPVYLADLGAGLSSSATATELQKVMEEKSFVQRLHLSLSLLKKEQEMSHLQQKIGKEVEDKVKQQHRKYLLNEQLKVIKRELGLEKDAKETIVGKLRTMAKKSLNGASDDVRQVVEDELKRLELIEQRSTEFNDTRTYIEWLVSLPWKQYMLEESSKDNKELVEEARVILDEDHYGMKDVKDRILEHIAVSLLGKKKQGKILCLVGAPGVGKTSVGKSVARALNRKFFRFSVGGLHDVAEIKGHRRTYVSALPGKFVQCLKKVQCLDPVILIDEIDKMGRGHQGDPSAALLEGLDPEQNNSFLDHYLDVPIDLSNVLFLCTANIIDSIPDALRDRLEILQVSGYVAEEKLEIAKRYLLPKSMKLCSVENYLNINDDALRKLINSYCRESGVRSLAQQIDRVCRKSALKIIETIPQIDENENKTNLEITDENLEKFAGKPRFLNERLYAEKNLIPGLCTGLAWTAMGGSTLYIETIILSENQKKPQLQITGKLGEVMKESVEIAHSFAQKFLQTKNNNDKLSTSNIHLHVPEGATPKDGPSAGVTIISALISLALNKSIPSDLAMTGEVSLTGKVLVIGGVKEKIIAAKRTNCKTIILPKDNRRSVDELEDFLKEGLTFHFVEHYSEIYKILFHV
ncbi:hypothetical protein SNEBB_007741 [Seison nebaliae]|nr:hypothetical protein SNEBB_007741 [Seison nebaliae]